MESRTGRSTFIIVVCEKEDELLDVAGSANILEVVSGEPGLIYDHPAQIRGPEFFRSLLPGGEQLRQLLERLAEPIDE